MVAIVGGMRLAMPRFPGHGTVVHDVIPPCGHKLRVKKRDRAVVLVDQGVEHVPGFPIEHDGRVGSRLDVDFVELLLPEADECGQLVGW